MHLDIIVPVLDERAALPGFLEHVGGLVTADGDAGVLVVDGGSTDGTVELLRGSRFPCISSGTGRALQMNAGAAATDGEALVFLHADTMLPDGALAAVRHAVAAGHAGGFFQVRLASRRRLLRLVGRAISLRSRLTGIATGDQAIFVTRTAFEQIGGYAPLPLFEDVDLCRRLRDSGSVARLPEVVVTSARRWHEHGPWRTILRMWLLRLLYAAGIEPRRLRRYYELAR